MSYIRLSNFGLADAKAICGLNSTFANLSDALQTQIINQAQSKIASLRNKLGKETYNFDTIGGGDAIVVVSLSATLPTKYLRFQVSSAGVAAIASQYGFTSTFIVGDIVYDSGALTIVVTSTGSEFTSTTGISRNNEDVNWARSATVGDSITFTLPDVLATIGDFEAEIKVF